MIENTKMMHILCMFLMISSLSVTSHTNLKPSCSDVVLIKVNISEDSDGTYTKDGYSTYFPMIPAHYSSDVLTRTQLTRNRKLILYG